MAMDLSKTFVIAEAGSNHNGNVTDAIKLIDIAKAAGANSVKFQFIFADGLYLPQFLVEGQYLPSSVYEQRAREELSEEEWKAVWGHAEAVDIDISASVFCSRGIELLRKLGASYVKIASTDLTNHRLISQACASFPIVILSTGMASLGEVSSAVAAALRSNPEVDLILMHCVSLYPCDFSNAKINRIGALKNSFNLAVGYSDHTEKEHSALLAWQEGARLFEKHFTFDQTLPGFDHAHALSPIELSNYCQVLKECSSALSWVEVQDTEEGGEAETKIRARRGVYASKELKKGHVIGEADILYVRPSSVYHCSDPGELIGSILESDVPRYGAIGLNGRVTQVDSNASAAQSYWREEMKKKKMYQND
jgi:N,N'-diacetyllegionaminate synthase